MLTEIAKKSHADSVMLDDRFRMRVDTGCTADSKDSGIDVHSRLRNISKRVHRREPLRTVMEDADEAKWDCPFFELIL
ncbi:hypothetical protein OESDEN_08232 [Oesophagostomum dentatum]|uniref:Uncharacterized protein n=1 Tax=Oesophagostomum dentatum TaxID=61180 RepID=A0A0B1T3S5_OESDE|nr:hypothetical protein OESDEN_08232 [Oesophagostomum dentatum]